jgi:hypothetical protein
MELSDVQKERFWARVNKTDDCWLWTGSLDKHGYGQVGLSKSVYRCHRVSYILSGNIIPEGLGLLHSCRSKNCVNPAHLTPGTQAQNVADMIRDGTLIHGEQKLKAKLTEQQVKHILARQTELRKDLAKEFGVNQSTIVRIIQRKKWKHIT